MDKQVELQSQTSEKDPNGEEILTYETYDTVWASIKPMQGGELQSAQQINEVVRHKIRIYYHPDIVPLDRILFGTRIFEIFNILNYKEENIYLDILCKEKV